MRVVAFTKYGREAASTRQRLLQYLPSLEAAGIEVDYYPLLGDDYVRGLATGKRPAKLDIGRSYVRRLKQLLRTGNYDLIWVYAELFPFLPGMFEKLAFLNRKPVIYDFDDAFFVPHQQTPRAWLRRLLGNKLRPLLSRATACTCGNEYLRDFARTYCEQSVVIPTVVDTHLYRPSAKPVGDKVVIGWIGSPSTWRDVRPLLPLLAELCSRQKVVFRAVGAGVDAERHRFDGLDLADWSEETEIAEVQAMDIGIMPMPDLPFQRGKSGYKLVQYMACGLPVVASPVGVNSTIVTHGGNGLLASSDAEWMEALERLIGDGALRRRMGLAGRALVVESYSLESQAPRLVELFKEVAASR